MFWGTCSEQQARVIWTRRQQLQVCPHTEKKDAMKSNTNQMDLITCEGLTTAWGLFGPIDGLLGGKSV